MLLSFFDLHDDTEGQGGETDRERERGRGSLIRQTTQCNTSQSLMTKCLYWFVRICVAATMLFSVSYALGCAPGSCRINLHSAPTTRQIVKHGLRDPWLLVETGTSLGFYIHLVLPENCFQVTTLRFYPLVDEVDGILRKRQHEFALQAATLDLLNR